MISPFASTTFIHLCLLSRNSRSIRKEKVFFLQTFYAFFSLLVMQSSYHVLDNSFKKIFLVRCKIERLLQVYLFKNMEVQGSCSCFWSLKVFFLFLEIESSCFWRLKVFFLFLEVEGSWYVYLHILKKYFNTHFIIYDEFCFLML